MTADAIIDEFRYEVARRAVQACWRAVYPNGDDDEPTYASIAFIDHALATAKDGNLSLGRRLERLENMLGNYLRTNSAVVSSTARPALELVST
jgi:hypothetical protein